MITGAEIYAMREKGLKWVEIEAQTGLAAEAARSKYRRYIDQIKRQERPVEGPGEQLLIEGDGNTREIESKGERITTLEQLIAFCKIDLEEWQITHHVINKWEVGAKNPLSGEVIVEPLFQVKVWLERRHPDAIKPVIQPVVVQARFSPSPKPAGRKLRAALIVPDTQFGFSREVMRGALTPFHDRAALDVVRQIARIVQPDRIIFLGDVMDYSGWSDKYIRRPEFFFTTQPALIESAWYIAQLHAIAGETDVLEGNHDQRPEKQIITHLVDAYGLRSADHLDASPVLSVDNLLGLSRMGVRYRGGYPDAEIWLNSTTRVMHGERVRAQPGQTAAAVVRDANENVIFGHIHRRELATRTIPGREGYRTVTAYSPGCLCHVDGRVPGSKRSDQWQQGCAVLYYDEDASAIVPVDIYQGRAVFQGHLIEGSDYVTELEIDTGWDYTGKHNTV